MTVYPGPQREMPVAPDSQPKIRDAAWRTTDGAGNASSPSAAVDLRESHLQRREDLIRRLGYPSMRLLK